MSLQITMKNCFYVGLHKFKGQIYILIFDNVRKVRHDLGEGK